jgi:glycosyltransferase involved in cell wall biosynthesis
MEPKVSVIIPCYNYADFLKICLESVLNQTFQDFEVIIVDDASTDYTAEIVLSYKDHRIKYIRHERNLGPSAAFNTGINLSQGKYIAIIGADDIMKPENLSEKVKILENYPEIGLVHSNAEIIDETGQVIGLARKLIAPNKVEIEKKLFDRLLYGNFIIASSVVARRDCYQKVGAYDTNLRHAEDWDMWLRLAYHYDFGYINSPLIQYRFHRKSLQHRNFAEHKDLLAMQRIIEKVFQEFDLDSKGYSYQHVYWSNYFRMLNNKLGVIPLREVLKLYLRGLRMYPKRLMSLKNAIFWGKVVGHIVFPQVVLESLRGLKYKG